MPDARIKLNASTVALGALVPSPLNARPSTHSAEDVADIIPSIRTVGLINPITVHALKKPKGKFGVLAGARRWRAMLELASDPAIDAAAIPVMIAEGTEAELRQLSIMENEQREEMHEVEMLRSFGALRKSDPNITDEQLAVAFGVGAVDVRRIMRLAAVHSEILDAFASGKIDRDVVRAFGATDDQARQLVVWNEVKGSSYIRAHEIRRALGFANGHDLSTKIAIVGADAFTAAGGKVAKDLFSDAMQIDGQEILDALFVEKIESLKSAYLVEHPKVTLIDSMDGLARGQYGNVDYDLRIDPKGVVPADQRPRWTALNVQITGIENDLEQLIDYDSMAEDEQVGDDPTTWPLIDDAAEGPGLVEQLVAAKAELAAIVPQIGIPDCPLLGVYVVQQTGLDVGLWYPSREAAGLPALSRSTSREAAGSQTSAAEKQRRDWGLTKDAMGAMLIVRREMVRDQLCYDRDLALDFLLFTQARTLLMPTPGYGGTFHLNGATVGITTPEIEDTSGMKPPAKVRALADTITRAPTLAKVVDGLKGDNAFKHPDPIEGFNLFRNRDDRFKQDVIVFVAGAAIRGADTYYGDPQTPRFIEAIADSYLGRNAQWCDSVTYDEAFFALINHKKRVALLDSWGQGDAAKRLKSGESAAYCAKVHQSCTDVFLSSAGESETVRGLLGIGQDDQDEIVNWKPDWFDPSSPTPFPNPGRNTDLEDAA